MKTTVQEIESIKDSILQRLRLEIVDKEKLANDKTQGNDFLIKANAEVNQLQKDKALVEKIFSEYGY